MGDTVETMDLRILDSERIKKEREHADRQENQVEAEHMASQKLVSHAGAQDFSTKGGRSSG